MNALKRIAVILAILFLAAQFIRPARTNSPVDTQLDIHTVAQVPADVSAILKRSCFDCHSNQTVWPWYSNITPVNWWMVESHIEHGREHHNFNEWGKMTTGDRDHMLDEICEEIEKDAMPLPSYLIIHGDARLSESQKRAVCDWTRAERERMKQSAAPSETPAAEPKGHGGPDHKH